MRLITRLFLSAIAFTSVLPMIHGISFHGSFVMALSLSAVFGVMLWAIESITVGLATVFAIGSFGLALIWLIPLWILGFWLMPVLALILTADVVPANLAISGFEPAAIAGCVLLLVSLLTSKIFWRDKGQRAR